MNWIQGLLYGLISGITEILPVSSQAHQRLLWMIFGHQRNPITNLVVHIATLLALLISCRGILAQMRREQRVVSGGRRKVHYAELKSLYDLRLIRTAMIPMLLAMLALVFTRSWADNNLVIALFALLNGVLLFVAERFPQSNKDSRHMSVLDAVLFGVFGALSILPGVSRVGASMAYSNMRGANKQHSLTWALILSIPALIVLCIFDFVDIITVRGLAINFSVIIGFFTAGFGAFIGTYLCASFIRTLLNRSGTAIFPYYSWSVSLLVFALYLIS